MFAASDYIVGWSYWTWKRAPAKFPDLNIIQVPPGWKAVMEWVANPFHKRPTQQEAVAAMEQFKTAVAIENTVPDKKLMDILAKY